MKLELVFLKPVIFRLKIIIPNETRGFKKEASGTSYVDRINKSAEATYKVPAIKPLNVIANNAITSNEKENEISLSEPVPQNQPIQQRAIRAWDIFEDF